MKKCLLLSLLALSMPAQGQANDYRMASVAHADIDKYLTIGTAQLQTPANLQGLWWMDGNPLADKVVSFGGVQFTPTKKDEQITGYECFLPVFDQGVWSWDDTEDGHGLYRSVLAARLTYHATFNRDFTHADVKPNVQVQLLDRKVEIPQSLVLDFSMTQVNSDEFSRDSFIGGIPSTYRFRRIVDGSGKRLPAYDEYLKSLAASGLKNAWIPICEADRSKSVPSECARRLP